MLRPTIESFVPWGSGVDWLIPLVLLMDESEVYNKSNSLRGVDSKRDVNNTDSTMIEIEVGLCVCRVP